MAANYVLLERIELNASAASVTFSNIPQSGYTDLKIVVSGRLDEATTYDSPVLYFNGVTTNFSFRQIYGTGTTVGSNSAANGNNFQNLNGTSSTASTFANNEIYIPNYTSSNYKSFSVDTVTENNSATGNGLGLEAGLWSNTAAITSIGFYGPSTYSFVSGSTFSLYGLAAVGTTPVIAPKASGGNITTDGTYWIHTFLATDTFTPATALTCDYLVVAGGGAGGGNIGAGGGAGGYRYLTSQSVTATSYTVTVGAGGASVASGNGNAGTASSFNSTSASGGGYGAGQPNSTGNLGGNGGSGGGGDYGTGSTTYAGGSGNTGGYSPVEGYAGGYGQNGSPARGGGGGGSSAVGVNGVANTTSGYGTGGAGTSNSITGTAVTYAGGGGGGTEANGFGGAGGTGGGGKGADGSTASGKTGAGNGTVNTGGGGGGGSDYVATSGAGGSGIVIIRYAMA